MNQYFYLLNTYGAHAVINKSILFICVFLVLSVTACGTNDTYVEQPGKFRCGDDGFCLTINTPTQFYGAFRDGDRELQFEVVYSRRDLLGVLLNVSRYCSRLLIESGYAIVHGPNCRADWADTPTGHSDFKYYIDIAKKFDAYMESREAPDDREEQWRELKIDIHSMATHSHTLPQAPEKDWVKE